MDILLVLLGIVVVIALAVIVIYNGLIAKRQTVNQAFADIDVARNSATSAGTVGEKAAAEGMLSGALGKLFALSEAYPDLKANTNFLDLQDELSTIEDKLAAARRFYNSAVGDYNTAKEQFPGVLIANSFGFEEREFFDVGEEGRETLSVVPEVKF